MWIVERIVKLICVVSIDLHNQSIQAVWDPKSMKSVHIATTLPSFISFNQFISFNHWWCGQEIKLVVWCEYW